jgi:hypothetical protein
MEAAPHLLIKERMQGMIEIGQWKDSWLMHPFPNMSEQSNLQSLP